MPNSKINEMFALAEQILGGRRVNVLCADGEMRLMGLVKCVDVNG